MYEGHHPNPDTFAKKPSKRSKTKDNICHLKRRLDLWSNGDILQLLDEGHCIQTRMLSRLATGKSKIDSRIFRSLMGQGKIKSALGFLSRDQSGGVLGLDEIIPQSQGKTTHDIPTEKHPPGKTACSEYLLKDSSETVNPIIYSNLDAECILKQPCIPRVLQDSLALMHMPGEDCGHHSSLPLMTCVMLLWL